MGAGLIHRLRVAATKARKNSETGESHVPRIRLTQEGVVLLLAILLFLVFTLTLPNFFTTGNLIALVRSVSILGILGLGMGLVVIARGIDLAMIATMVVTVSWVLSLTTNSGMPLGNALLLGAALAVLIGLTSGVLIAYANHPGDFHDIGHGAGGLRRRAGLAVPGRCPKYAGKLRAFRFSRPSHYLRRTNAYRRVPLPCRTHGGGRCYGRVSAASFTPWATIRRGPHHGLAAAPDSCRPVCHPSLIAFAAGIVMAATVSGMSTRLSTIRR